MEKIIELIRLCPRGFGIKYDQGIERFEIVYNLKKNKYTSGKTLEEAVDKAIEILTT